MQLRPMQPKKKKKSERLSPYSHVSHSPVGCHRSKKKWHTSSHWGFTNSTPSPAENPPVTPQCVCACSVAQACQTLCSPMNCSWPGSSVHGVLQARILEWVSIPFSRGSFQSRDRTRDSWIAGGFFTTDPPGKPRKSSLQCLSWQRPIKRLQKQDCIYRGEHGCCRFQPLWLSDWGLSSLLSDHAGDQVLQHNHLLSQNQWGRE